MAHMSFIFLLSNKQKNKYKRGEPASFKTLEKKKLSRINVIILGKRTWMQLWEREAQGWDPVLLKHQRNIKEREWQARAHTHTHTHYPTELLNSIIPDSTWEYLLRIQYPKNQKTWQYCVVRISPRLKYQQRRDLKCPLQNGHWLWYQRKWKDR